MYHTHIPLIMKDHRTLKENIQLLSKELKASKVNKDCLRNLILMTFRELYAIEDEMDLLIEQGFYPNHNVPILELLIDPKKKSNEPDDPFLTT